MSLDYVLLFAVEYTDVKDCREKLHSWPKPWINSCGVLHTQMQSIHHPGFNSCLDHNFFFTFRTFLMHLFAFKFFIFTLKALGLYRKKIRYVATTSNFVRCIAYNRALQYCTSAPEIQEGTV